MSFLTKVPKVAALTFRVEVLVVESVSMFVTALSPRVKVVPLIVAFPLKASSPASVVVMVPPVRFEVPTNVSFLVVLTSKVPPFTSTVPSAELMVKPSVKVKVPP